MNTVQNVDIFDSSIDITSTYQSTVIWSHRSFCGNCLSSLHPVAVLFFFSKTYCVSFKEWKSLQSIFRDVNQRLVRAETKYKGSECCFCVSYLITRSWVTTRLSLFRDRVWDTNLNHLWGKRCSWTAVWYSSEHKKHILCKRFLALCLNISSSFERVCGCFQVPF